MKSAISSIENASLTKAYSCAMINKTLLTKSKLNRNTELKRAKSVEARGALYNIIAR